MRPYAFLAIAAGLIFAPHQSAIAAEPDGPQRLIPASEAFGIAIRQNLLRSIRDISDADDGDRVALAEFYINRDHKPLWIDSDGTLIDKSESVMAIIRQADDWGLVTSDYQLPAPLTSTSSQKQQIKAEIMLSLAVLKYARHAKSGRVANPTKYLSSYIDRRGQAEKPSVVLDAVLSQANPGQFLESLHPKHPQFVKLRKMLLDMRNGELEKDEDAPVLLPARGPMLRLDIVHPDVSLLRQRLKVTDETDDPNLFDEFVLAAVKQFQQDNGLRTDGLVGRGTRRKLNGGKKARPEPTEDLLLANMEAWRWMPENLGERYIFVNIPEYKVRVVANDEVVHEERVIVGKTHQQTPVFSDKMKTVVLHPQWGVPNSIKVNEILPRLARGHSLARQGLRIQRNGRDINPQSIDWSRADIRNYHVYQPSGRSNALGVVKFMFPNKHSVYLHDTPKKSLFNTSRRTYSHGCIRVRNPLRLAEVLLEADKGWQATQVRSLLKSGPQNNNIAIKSDIRVHVNYFTAWVDDNGKLKTWSDIYGHEKRIKLALAGRYDRINRGRDHLAPVKYDRQRIARIREQNGYFGGGYGGNYGGNYGPPKTLLEAIFGGF
ncbi:MAG: L,D-transpeptidase family protein [Hyphomicrobiaceae bacterium]